MSHYILLKLQIFLKVLRKKKGKQNLVTLSVEKIGYQNTNFIGNKIILGNAAILQ